MSDLNSYSFSGRLAAAPELKYSQGGTAVWSGRVAVGYGYGDNKGPSWLTIKALGKRAEALGKWTLDKGQQVWGCGELQVREYEKSDGSRGVSVDVLVEQFGSAASDSSQRGNTSSTGSRGGAPQRERPQRATDPAPDDDFSDEIPFISNCGSW